MTAPRKTAPTRKLAGKLLRNSPVALHRQLTDQLRAAIRSGIYKQGGRIPTEPELAQRHQVSRITARQAVMQLVREGLVVRQQGKGTFVTAPPVQHDPVDLRGLYDELVAQGVNPTTELLEFGDVLPPPRVAERLRSGNAPLVSWKRLYLREGKPFAVAWVYLAGKVPRITRELVAKHTSYHIFETLLKIKIDHADLSIRAQRATAEMRKLLQMPPATPVIALERVSYLTDGAPIEYTLYCAHADVYEYAFKVRDKVDIASALAQRAVAAGR